MLGGGRNPAFLDGSVLVADMSQINARFVEAGV